MRWRNEASENDANHQVIVVRLEIALTCGGATPHAGSMRLTGSEAPAAREVRPCTFNEALADWMTDMAARGVKASSVDRFTTVVRKAAAACNWAQLSDATYASTVKYIAAKRQTGDWSPATHDQVVSAFKNFGRSMVKLGHLTASPFEGLEASGEVHGEGCRAATVEDVRSIIRAAIHRRVRNKAKAKGNAPTFYAVLALTGLRHEEACCVQWKDVQLDPERPMIITDPAWAKNRRRQRIVLNDEARELLIEHRNSLGDDAGDVFPISPNRHTLATDREYAKIPHEDERGRIWSFHSLRKFLATELDRRGATPGVLARIMRHAENLDQQHYIDPSADDEYAAIRSLPTIWPELRQKMEKSRSISLDRARKNADDVEATQVSGQSMHTSTRQPADRSRLDNEPRVASHGSDLGAAFAGGDGLSTSHSTTSQSGNGQTRT